MAVAVLSNPFLQHPAPNADHGSDPMRGVTTMATPYFPCKKHRKSYGVYKTTTGGLSMPGINDEGCFKEM
jgi:hypothetical protein